MFVGGGCCFGQVPDSVYLQKPLQYALTLYENGIGEASHLYNGPQYVNYDKYYIEGHQFFRTDEASPGNIFFDGTLYTQAPMLYDLVLDEIVLDHPNSEFQFTLVTEKIKYFTFQGHTFIRLEKDSVGDTPLKGGFYDLLHDGQVKLLAKRTKNLQEQATMDGMKGRFESANKYYIRKENIYYPVKDKRSLLKTLPDKRKELQRYAREQKIKFGKNREKALLQLTQFYDKPNA
ncbi:MAG: hypothetical protein JWQ14_851 [Adhaeribacter sp.]|nr:hypothetical protein [Adhaeribacter sp.]